MRYLETLKQVEMEKQASSGKAQIDAPARSMKDVKREVMGYETKGDMAYYPAPPLTLGSMFSATKLPTTKPKMEMVLLPNAKVSPTIGIGLGGLQTRVRVDRRPEAVPKGSVVGKGLENQSAIGGAADISIKQAMSSEADLQSIKDRIAAGDTVSMITPHPGALGELRRERNEGRGLGGVLGGALGGGAGLLAGGALGNLAGGGRLGTAAKVLGGGLGAVGGGIGGGLALGNYRTREAVKERVQRGDPLFQRLLFSRQAPEQ